MKNFQIKNEEEFNSSALEIFYLQAEKNEVYKNYLKQLNVSRKKIFSINQIPFLPVEFFKTHKVFIRASKIKTSKTKCFTSSGTTGTNTAKHYVHDISVYENSFTKCFEFFHGNIQDYCLLALLPSYLERKNSSLIYMANYLIKKTKNEHSGFYLKNHSDLFEKLQFLEKKKQKTILLGVSFALLDFAEKFSMKLNNTIIMETGGMKGRQKSTGLLSENTGGKEMVRQELHEKLCKGFGVKTIHSEYGMTELLSQAYSSGNGFFRCPSWMKIFIRDVNDNFQILKNECTGGINIIDLANINSCSFIATQDLGTLHDDGSFEVLGRFDNSDLRGCNLLLK